LPKPVDILGQLRAAVARGVPILTIDMDADGNVSLTDTRSASLSGERKQLTPPTIDDIALVLHTSGSTGRPKRVPLAHKNLSISAQNVARSYDLTGDDVAALASTPVVATLLPGAEFGTRQPFPDARRLLDAGATVALATDCNPGSSFTTSMPFCIALAVREMGMTTQEAVWAATAGGARALRRTDIGRLGAGARADLILLDAPSHAYLAYRPGVPQVAAVWQAGRLVAGALP